MNVTWVVLTNSRVKVKPTLKGALRADGRVGTGDHLGMTTHISRRRAWWPGIVVRSRPRVPSRARSSIGYLAVLGSLVLATGPNSVDAQVVQRSLWAADGWVNSIVPAAGVLYVGGGFSLIGPVTGNGAMILKTNGRVPSPYPLVLGSVNAATSDGSGGWYVGGSFTSVGGVSRAHLFHVDAAGNVTGWDPAPDGPISALARRGGTVYVAGLFSSIGGQARHRLAALDGVTGAATAWNPLQDPYSGGVGALIVVGGTVYVAGSFSVIGGAVRQVLAGLDATTGVATEWNPHPNGSVSDLASGSGTIYAAGSFSVIGGRARNRLAALDAATGAATDWDPNPDSGIDALAVAGATVVVSGGFHHIGGATRDGFAGLDVETGVARAWDVTPLGAVYALAASGDTVYLGGTNLAALNAMSGEATDWNPLANDDVHFLAAGEGTVYAGGEFTSVGGKARSNIAALDMSTGEATDWNPGADGEVRSLAFDGSALYAGGAFTHIGGQPRMCIAAFDGVTGTLTPWDPNLVGNVNGLAISDGAVIAGGDFYWCGTWPDVVMRPYLAALDPASGLATSWNPSPDGPIWALASGGSTVYAAGSFTNIGGQPRNYLAALDAASGVATGWNPSPDAVPSVLSVNGGTLYAGGSFTMIGGEARDNLAAIDLASGSVTPWAPNPNSLTLALAVSGGTVYVGGGFTHIGGQSRNSLAAVDATTGAATPWNPEVYGGYVGTLCLSGEAVVAGGAFDSVLGLPFSRIAAFTQATLDVSRIEASPRVGEPRASPNPSLSDITLRFAIPRRESAQVSVYDIGGRLIRDLRLGVIEAGEHGITWDGRDGTGRLVSAGVYLVRVRAGEFKASTRIARMR